MILPAKQACDTFDAFFENLPKGARLVGVELDKKASDLETFEHPRRCVYLLGAEKKSSFIKKSNG